MINPMRNMRIINIEGNSIDISLTNIHNKCRSCLIEDGTVNIFEAKHQDLLFTDIITIFSIFQADKEDGLPQKICQSCADLLIQFYSFKQVTGENQIILRIASTKLNSMEYLVSDKKDLVELESLDMGNEIVDNEEFIAETETVKEENVTVIDHDYASKATYTCPCCYLKFSDKNDFIKHRMEEAKADRYKNKVRTVYTCLYCNIKFKSRNEFMAHMKQKEKDYSVVSTRGKEFTCPKCYKTFDRRVFLTHRRLGCNADLPSKAYKEHKCGNFNFKFNLAKKYLKNNTELKCSLCNEKFHSMMECLLQQKKEAVNNPSIKLDYTCPYCKLKFYSKSEYLKHKKEEARKKSMCPYCKKIMHSSKLENHLRCIHKSLPPLKCEVCGKRFISETIYNKHILGHKEGYFCEYCGKKCLTEVSLKFHIKVHEREKSRPDIFCHICDKRFKKPYLYRQHMYSHTGDKPYLCSVCGVMYNKQSLLHQHHLAKHVSNPFKCDLCGNLYDTDKKLKLHIKRHEDEKNNECEICGQRFKLKACLIQHMKRHNSENKEIKTARSFYAKGKKEKVKLICLSCNKEYDSCGKINFQIHIRSHLMESAHLCLFCGRQFDDENEYSEHMEIHGDKKLEKVYVCEICQKVNASKAALRNHFRYHTGEKPFQCNQCGKHFHIRAHLNTHLFWHTGQKPYRCKFCGKCFGMKGNLEQHEKTHVGQRDYMCNICEKSFYTNSSLRKHLQIHSKMGFDIPELY